MVTHWESSNRPLFIKTVWKDGQHHVLLNNNAEEVKSGQSSSRKSTASSSRNTNSRKASKCGETKMNFRIPTVQLLYTGFKRSLTAGYKTKKLEESQISFKHDTITTVDIIPCNSLRIKNINKEVAFGGKTANILWKSKSVDVNNHRDINIEGIATQPTTINDQFQTTLNEKVMIWLDLATQKTNNNLEKNCNETKKHSALQKKHRTFNVAKSNHQNVPNYKYDYDERKLEKLLKKEVTSEESNQNFINVVPALINQEIIPKTHIDNNIEKSVKDFAGKFNGKRQLHIFMPKLPKKCSEADSLSFLSSKGNSLLKVRP